MFAKYVWGALTLKMTASQPLETVTVVYTISYDDATNHPPLKSASF
jgi:hypothetical protein